MLPVCWEKALMLPERRGTEVKAYSFLFRLILINRKETDFLLSLQLF
jgi:hypothetical protein